VKAPREDADPLWMPVPTHYSRPDSPLFILCLMAAILPGCLRELVRLDFDGMRKRLEHLGVRLHLPSDSSGDRRTLT
jgi:hypothetical protein